MTTKKIFESTANDIFVIRDSNDFKIRGIRNNNPGNIEKGQDFKGEVSELPNVEKEERFAQFEEIGYGIRAIFKILKTYRKKHKINTIQGIVSRWAPPKENSTKSYVDFVASIAGIPAILKIKAMGDLPMAYMYTRICEGIIKMETGLDCFNRKILFEIGVAVFFPKTSEFEIKNYERALFRGI